MLPFLIVRSKQVKGLLTNRVFKSGAVHVTPQFFERGPAPIFQALQLLFHLFCLITVMNVT
jgi:hypothetical protein